MLHKLNDLDGFHIHATDGHVGVLKDFYFDDKQWLVRHFIVETGSWLDSHKVLLKPATIEYFNLEEKVATLSLTMNQVKNSPLINTQLSVAQKNEIDYLSYYGYPFYEGVGIWGGYASPDMIGTGNIEPAPVSVPMWQRQSDPQIAEAFATIDTVRRKNGDRHLRSCKEIQGYHIQALDGEIGHLEGMLVDEDTWAVRYLIVNTSNWWLGHKVLLSPSWITDINWANAKISVDMTQQQVKDAPLFDPDIPFGRQEELGIHIHYGRSGYWEDYEKVRQENSMHENGRHESRHEKI